MPRSRSNPFDEWEIPCFGGPLHGRTAAARDEDRSFRAMVQARHSLRRLEQEMQAVANALSVSYEIAISTFSWQVNGQGAVRRQIRCGIAENISRSELIEYRDYLHERFDEFNREMDEDLMRRALDRR